MTARAILIGLDVGLDHENGGDVAEALARVYRSMRRKLDNAVAANDADENALACCETHCATPLASTPWNGADRR